jgi:phosphoesterase RecJ-like protein
MTKRQTENKNIEKLLEGAENVAIAGHVSPDGDCIGSCLGLWIYLRDNFPQIHADVYMQEIPEIYKFLDGADKLINTCTKQDAGKYDRLFLLDISSYDRIGVALPIYEGIGMTICLDHHRTNQGSYTYFCNEPEVSSTSEVLYSFLDPDKISEKCAEAIYMGIVHDTGVFKYPATSPETMRIAAGLMEKGINFSKIIDETFYQKSFLQQKILGHILENSRLYLDGKLLVGTASRKERLEMGLKASDLDGVVSQLRDTIGVEVAVLLYELDNGEFKASFRSREIVDVSEVCVLFGGGGHIRAAGCKIQGSAEDIIGRLVPIIEEKLKG